ncbi:MAG: integrase core domain-containing protein [Myxococcota bacterium]|nr:integrase core domain-containing protein [Myxococcota bacterium]
MSMDGVGRTLDNIFVERLWRSLKYAEVYLQDYEHVVDAIFGIDNYFYFYNDHRLHQALNYLTPGEVYHSKDLGSEFFLN